MDLYKIISSRHCLHGEHKKGSHMKKHLTSIQCRDTGLALVFLMLLLWWFSPRPIFVHLAMIILLATMLQPGAMRWPAKLWFGLSHVLGTAMNKVILGLLFSLIVLPVALLRKALGKDPMGFSQWKNGKQSVFVARDHLYTKDDLRDTF